MTDQTILVIDVEQETEEKIVSTLEAEDYLVFAASGREITSGMAGKLSPALIFLKPTSNSVEGFEVCKAIHSSEAFKNVPIIVIASLKSPLDARYTSFYGIVDFMEMPVRPEAIIEKTEKILGGKFPVTSEPVAEDIGSFEDETASAEETPVTQAKGTADKEFTVEEGGEPSEDYSYKDEEVSVTASRLNRGRRRPAKSGLMVPVLLVTAAVVIVAGGFLIYKLFLFPEKARLSVKAAAPKAAQQKVLPVLPPAVQQPNEQPGAEDMPAAAKETPQTPPQARQQASKQAQQKAPAVLPAAKPAVEPFHSVQLGAFKSEVSAEALAKVYKGKGHEAFAYRGTTKDNKTLYRVLIGKFKNRKEAAQLAGKLQATEKIKTTVFSEGM